MNGKELLSRAIVTGGVLLSGGSIVDFAVNNGALQKQIAQDVEISREVNARYGIKAECVPTGMFGGGGDVHCYDTVPGVTNEEERKILDTAHEEIQMLQEQVHSPEAETRGTIELAGLLGGLIIATTMSGVKKE